MIYSAALKKLSTIFKTGDVDTQSVTDPNTGEWLRVYFEKLSEVHKVVSCEVVRFWAQWQPPAHNAVWAYFGRRYLVLYMV